MKRGVLAVVRAAFPSSLPGGYLAPLGCFLLFASSLNADRFRGQARHEFLDNIPVGGAELEMVDTSDPTQSATLFTDALGYFETSVFDAGDEVRITATHPAYQQETPVVTLENADVFESILMTPLGDVTTDFHDIIIQISGAVTQLPLRNVPVEITRWDEDGNLVATYSHVTDTKGIAIQRGAPTGFYEFKINDSSLPDAERQARYEDYATPLLGRVDIHQNHFTNVFLKPLKQDLKVRVRGYDFEEKEFDAALENVLVEIRGLDPHDTDIEVLHPRSDYTVFFPAGTGGVPGPGQTVDDGVFYLDDGEVVFKDLPPVAYEIKVMRYGYVTQRILLEPDAITGLLPNSYDNPLAVSLSHEHHRVDILVDYEDYFMATFDDFGRVDSSGVTGLGLNVRVVGLEGTNTEGLEYELTTIQNLNGETYAPINEPFLAGRYRVYVDGMSQEQPLSFNTDFQFFQTVGHAFDLGATGESVLEITPGHSGIFIKRHRHTVTLETPIVFIRGQLMAAESVEPDSGKPIFRPFANQTIEIISNPSDDLQIIPTSVTTETDADGRFNARVLPGLYGVRLPGLTNYFGDEAIMTVTAAVNEQNANETETYDWPLAEAFPEVAGATSLHNHRYWELHGIPIHVGREQFLELRVRKELYNLEDYGTEQTNLTTRVVAITSDGGFFGTSYSPTLANQTEVILTGSTGTYTTDIEPEPPGSFVNPLFARWENLPPGDYSGISATIPAHTFSTESWRAKTFLDWPEPGAAPTPEQAALFDGPNLPNNELLHEPLQAIRGSGFAVNMTDYTAAPYSIFRHETREIDGEDVTGYHLQRMEGTGFPMESTFAPGYFEGFAELGGPITAVWTFGENDEGETYRVRMTPGSSLFLRGPSPTLPSSLPTTTYSLQLDGVAATDHSYRIDGANYQMGSSGRPILTGETISGLSESPFVSKSGGDNFFQQFQSNVRVVTDGISPTLAITVGLEQGMQVDATVQDMTPTGSGNNPIDIPAMGIPVEARNRYGRLLQTKTTDAEGKVKFEALPGFADYFLSVNAPGFTPTRQRLSTANATLAPDSSTSAKHDVAQNVVLLPRPGLHEPGVPHNRWGLFLPTVSRSGDVDAEKGINDFDFFAARDALTTTWKLEATPHILNVTLPGFDASAGAPTGDETLTGPDAIVGAYLIDERRFQKDGFVGGTDPLENEVVFDIPPDDEPTELSKLISTIREATKLQGEQVGFSFQTKSQRRIFVDSADTIKIDTESGRTVITGTMPIWDLPPGDFDPVIVLETQRGAYRVYDVPYEGADTNKRLHGPELPPWFANVLDLLGIASGIASTQGRLEETFKDYVPEGSFIPLPEFSATVTVDKEDDMVDEGYLQYAFTLAMAQEIGQDSKAEGLLSLGPGIIGAKTKVEGKLTTDGKTNATAFTLTGSITKDNLIDEAYGTKIAPIGGSSVSFENPTGKVSTTASTNYPVGVSDQDPLKFSLSATAGIGAKAKVSATLNNYARAIPYAGPVIGILGDTNALKLDAFIEGRAAVSQTFTLETEFPRERKLTSRPRSEPVPQQSFLGENKIKLDSEFCIGVGFSTGLELTALLGFSKANLAFEVGGAGCGVSDDIGTMELKINPTGGWPFITEIKGEAKVTAEASAGAGPAKVKGKWEFAKVEFAVQFGTDTIVTHYPFTADFLLTGDLAEGEGLFIESGPELVGGLAPAAQFEINGTLTETLAFTTVGPSGHAVLQIARRTEEGWQAPTQVELAPQIGVSTTLTLGDGRTLVVYSIIVDGQDPHDPYSDYQIFSRIIAVDGTVGPQTSVAFISNPVDQLALAESGSLVEMHVKAPATDGSQNFWQMFLTPFNKTDSTWGTTQFRVNEADNFDIHLTSGGATGADEILLHWITQSGDWKWLRTTDTTPQSVSGSYAAAPASWATASFYELAIPTDDGRILSFDQTPLTGIPSERGTPLIEGVFATEVGLTQQSVTPGGGYLLAWVERSGPLQELAYLTYGPDGIPVLGRQPITNNLVGEYSDLILTPQNNHAAYLFARFTNDDFSSLRTFELDLINGLSGNDSDGDGLIDPAELRIVDADPLDDITTVSEVLDSDDFDGDGVTNGDEIRAGSDPANSFSKPTPPVILTGPADLTAQVGTAAEFSVAATGDNLSYQWRRNGLPMVNELSASLSIAPVRPEDAGFYDVAVQNNGGTVISPTAKLAVEGGDFVRGAINFMIGVTNLPGDDLAHMPFLVEGEGTKRLLLRALGPAVTTNSSTGQPVAADPHLALLNLIGEELGANADWADSPDSGAAAQSAATTMGAIPLATGSLDAALVIELPVGNYTLQVGSNDPGLVYVELIDLDDPSTATSRLASVGLHSRVEAQGFAPSLGFVVSSPGDRDVISRYLGPALGTVALLDPKFDLLTGGIPALLIGANDNWENGNLPPALADAIRGVPLAAGSQDAARVDRLLPGSYLLNALVGPNDEGFGMLELIDPLASANSSHIAVLVPPTSQAAAAGSTTAFNVLAIADGVLSYQWNFEGQPIAGATNSTLMLSNVQPAAEGTYSVQLSASGETVTTASATLSVLGGGPVRASQSSNVNTVQPSGTATITVLLEWDETPINLAYQTTLPTGWIMRSQAAAAATSAPTADSTGALIWQFGTGPGVSPLNFSFEIEAPAELTGSIALTGAVSHEPTTGTVIASEALPHPLRIGVSPGFHDADTDRDSRLGLSELLRVISLYNTRFGSTRTGRYRILSGTTDGFDPDSSSDAPGSLSRHHTADFDRDAKISLSELLRVIELYNTRSGTTRTGGYRADDNATDGFTPDP